MRGRYLGVILVEMLIAVSTIVAYKIAAARWGGEGFGEYLLARRAVPLFQLPLLLGVGLGIPRYVAIAVAGADRATGDRQGEILVAGLMLTGFVAIPVLLVVWFLRSFVSGLIYGGVGYDRYMGPVILAVAGLILHAIAYAYACGRLRMWVANSLKGVNLGAVPLLAVAWPDATVAGAVARTGAIWLVVSGAVLILTLMSHGGVIVFKNIRTSMKELFRYGFPRVPGEFALVGLFSLPAVLAAHVAGVEAAGHIGFAIALLSGSGMLLAPVSVVLLPTASGLLHLGRKSDLRAHVKKLLLVGVGVAVLIAGTLELFAVPIFKLVLGEAPTEAVLTARVVLAATVPYGVYLLLRSVLDAMEVKALNARNLILALILTVMVSLLYRSALAVAGGLAAGIVLLGCLTALEVRRRI